MSVQEDHLMLSKKHIQYARKNLKMCHTITGNPLILPPKKRGIHRLKKIKPIRVKVVTTDKEMASTKTPGRPSRKVCPILATVRGKSRKYSRKLLVHGNKSLAMCYGSKWQPLALPPKKRGIFRVDVNSADKVKRKKCNRHSAELQGYSADEEDVSSGTDSGSHAGSDDEEVVQYNNDVYEVEIVKEIQLAPPTASDEASNQKHVPISRYQGFHHGVANNYLKVEPQTASEDPKIVEIQPYQGFHHAVENSYLEVAPQTALEHQNQNYEIQILPQQGFNHGAQNTHVQVARPAASEDPYKNYEVTILPQQRFHHVHNNYMHVAPQTASEYATQNHRIEHSAYQGFRHGGHNNHVQVAPPAVSAHLHPNHDVAHLHQGLRPRLQNSYVQVEPLSASVDENQNHEVVILHQGLRPRVQNKYLNIAAGTSLQDSNPKRVEILQVFPDGVDVNVASILENLSQPYQRFHHGVHNKYLNTAPVLENQNQNNEIGVLYYEGFHHEVENRCIEKAPSLEVQNQNHKDEINYLSAATGLDSSNQNHEKTMVLPAEEPSVPASLEDERTNEDWEAVQNLLALYGGD